MQHHAALAYQQTARQTANPRDVEANLLSRSAARLQRAMDGYDGDRSDYDDALDYNRRLWNILVTSVTREDNPLPAPIRENIANIGIFILSQTLALQAEPMPQKLDSLININKNLAAGLRAAPSAA